MIRVGALAELHRGPSPIRWTSAACSHVGRVRTNNEDAYLHQPALGHWAVADGMGGHALGELASRWVIDGLSAVPSCESLDELLAAANRQLQAINERLRDEAALRVAPVIGSTVAALFACGRHCGYLWAGDSRIYLFRNGRLRQLTRDHTYGTEGRSQITRAVGAADTLELDAGKIEVIDDDVFLLCSDGLSNEVHDTEMSDALASGSSRHAAASLLELALERGGRDNISVVVASVEDLLYGERTVINPAV